MRDFGSHRLAPGNECRGDGRRLGKERGTNSNVIPAFIAGIQSNAIRTIPGNAPLNLGLGSLPLTRKPHQNGISSSPPGSKAGTADGRRFSVWRGPENPPPLLLPPP